MGLQILSRRSLLASTKQVSCNKKRFTAAILNMSVDNIVFPILLACVYMHVDDNSELTDVEFDDVCGCLSALIDDCNVAGYIIARDFNCQFNSTSL